MLGAIIGDIVGSVYEWNNIKTKEFPLFRDDCFFTDDSVMTCAVAEGIMDGGKESDFVHAMQEYGQGYPDSIFLCRYYFGGYGKKDFPAGHSGPEDYKNTIRAYITQVYGYDLSRTLDEIRPTYQFNETCQETVPQALTAFFESTDFEDAIRNAISLGGDSDTLTAITGSIAEAAYGVPDWIQEKARSYLDELLLDVLSRWEKYRAENGMK